MNCMKAIYDTIKLAGERDYDNIMFDEANVDYAYLVGMMKEVEENPNLEKLAACLGYMHGVLIANGCITAQEAMEINRDHAQPPRDYYHKKRGTYYQHIGEARLNFTRDTLLADLLKDGEMLVLYRGEDGVYSVRHPVEMNDGRFTKLTE